jgi:hypothetical protein
MAAIATQSVVGAGMVPTYAAASGGGDTATPGSTSFLAVVNAGGSPVTVTVAAFPDVSPWGTAIPDNAISVTNGTTKWIGPLYGASYANPSTGLVGITYSTTTSVTVGVFSL